MSSASPAKTPQAGAEPRKESLRDTMESIVFAFILAFLFRTFEAEAFVIPTGSMAPTLYGRHKEADCPKCGMKIVVGASDEYDADEGLLRPDSRLLTALCPNCRYENKDFRDALAFNGDRILVNKFPYEIGEPHRWDVFVFKYPEQPEMNYIKRLVGLPGETLHIRQGDVYRWDGSQESILRKADASKQRALQMTVYDDSHPPMELIQAGWPERWAAVEPATPGIGGWGPAAAGWKHSPESRSFRLETDAAEALRWVRYRHVVPDPSDWERLEAGQPLDPKAQLIVDFCGYNATRSENELRSEPIDVGAFWVGDLTINFTLDVTEAANGGEVVFELCEGIYRYRCHIDLRNGKAKLFEIKDALTPDEERPLAEAATAMNGPGEYQISFANVDDRICLWINDALIDFGEGALLERNKATDLPVPGDRDLCPAGIAAQGVTAVLKNLEIQRDVYYRAVSHSNIESVLAAHVASPREWAGFYQANSEDDEMSLQVDPDGFLALGDNSPRSKDSRMWAPGMQSVPRNNLVGRAFYIYWPHGVPFMNGGRGYPLWYHKQIERTGGGTTVKKVDDYPKWTAPFYPQIDRMKRIR